MKIWANDINIGQKVWYKYIYNFKCGIVKEKDTRTFRMPTLIMDNGDRIFVNEHVYTEREDLIGEPIENMIIHMNSKVNDLENKRKTIDEDIEYVKKQITKLQEFRNQILENK